MVHLRKLHFLPRKEQVLLLLSRLLISSLNYEARPHRRLRAFLRAIGVLDRGACHCRPILQVRNQLAR
jgi:hypothetical protein